MPGSKAPSQRATSPSPGRSYRSRSQRGRWHGIKPSKQRPQDVKERHRSLLSVSKTLNSRCWTLVGGVPGAQDDGRAFVGRRCSRRMVVYRRTKKNKNKGEFVSDKRNTRVSPLIPLPFQCPLGHMRPSAPLLDVQVWLHPRRHDNTHPRSTRASPPAGAQALMHRPLHSRSVGRMTACLRYTPAAYRQVTWPLTCGVGQTFPRVWGLGPGDPIDQT